MPSRYAHFQRSDGSLHNPFDRGVGRNCCIYFCAEAHAVGAANTQALLEHADALPANADAEAGSRTGRAALEDDLLSSPATKPGLPPSSSSSCTVS